MGSYAQADDQNYLLPKMAAAVKVSIIATRPDGRVIYWNPFAEELYGWQAKEVLGRNIIDIMVPAESVQSATNIIDSVKGGEVWSGEFTVTRKDQSELTVLVADSPIFDENGDTIGIVGVSRDVKELVRERLEVRAPEYTALRITNRDLSQLTARLIRLPLPRLIHAHDEELASMVKELHDYIDRLMLLHVLLDRLHQSPPASWAEMQQEIGEARQQVECLFIAVQNLSHRLHSPKLEYLGLVAASSSFCRELSDRYHIPIDFASEGVPEHLPQEISLALFHVLQEASQNAASHSGSRRVQVLLKGKPSELALTVRDWGRGFNPEETLKRAGLAIMNERMEMIDGELSIESNRQQGTTIQARVSLKQRTERRN